MGDKAKRVIAVIGVVFMVIFSISIVFVFINPKMLNGAFGYIALLSAIVGAACFVVVKYVFREEKDYLPKTDDTDGDNSPAEMKESEDVKESSLDETKETSEESSLDETEGTREKNSADGE